ncbi:MAG: hypothetical protein NTW28_29260, partial [Candidatus Solibacter sp.]|nr:hypothetical protein [Candidatus Solibacter sp.]
IHRNNQSSFERVFFDWTCEWGANWLRPLKLLGLLSLICTIIYRTGMHFEMRSGLYLAATGQRIRTDKGRERTIRIGCHHPARILTTNVLTDECAPSVRPKARLIALRRRLRLEFTALGTAFLFSLMSVFNIGFREFNFGRWVRMMQPREFDIRARGWIRTVSGVQSLLGFAFAVLSLLSYFGRPFD